MTARITNPPLSGSLLTYCDTTKFKLSVNSPTEPPQFEWPNETIVPLCENSKFNLISLDVSYDGKTLIFTEFPTTPGALPTYANEHWVKLEMDLGEGLKTYFSGRVRKLNCQQTNREPYYSYECVGMQQLANDITLLDLNLSPNFVRVIGTNPVTVTTSTLSSSGHIYAAFIGATITDIFTINSERLGEVFISTDIGSPGPDTYPFDLGMPIQVTIQNMQFYDGLASVGQYHPQMHPFYDDLQTAWTFPDVLNAPEIRIDISTVNLSEGLNYTLDTNQRFTRVQFQTVIDGRARMELYHWKNCWPAWDRSLERSWCMQRTGRSTPSDKPSNYTWVYRLWKIPLELCEGLNPQCNYRAIAQFDFFGIMRWVPISAYIDLKEGWIVAQTPVVVRGNAWAKGKARGPDYMIFVYNTVHDVPVSNWFSLTSPAEDFEGNCFDLYGMQKTKYESVDPSQMTNTNVISKLNMLKDVVVSGSVPIEGDPIPELINLNRRIYFTHPIFSTSVQSFPALLTSYKYEFGKRGRSTIEFTTDYSAYLRVN